MFSKILVPIDLHRESSWRRALPVAAKQAGLFGASVILLYVVPAAWPIKAEPHEDDDHLTRIRELASEYFDNPAQVEVRVEHHNSPHRSILGVAVDDHVDLIVMNSHDPEMHDHLLGSNASEVVHRAACSVFVVR